MTEKLQTLMREQADSVDFAAPDLDAMIATGDRRLRRRRIGAVAGIAAVTAGVALVAPYLVSDQRAIEPAAPTGSAAPISWVMGSTLHEGDRSVELDFAPRAYVRTAEGYLFVDGRGAVWSWEEGERTLVGQTDARRPHLVSDEESGLAGWVAEDGSEYVVVEQVAGTIKGYPAPPGVDPEDFLALDDGTGYWQGENGPVAFDLETRRTSTFDVSGTVADVEDNLVAVRTDAGISVRTVGGEELRLLDGFHGELGSFSDDARYFTNDADEPQVYDVAAGERVPLDVGGRGFATGYEWLGARTLAVIAAQHDGAVAELLVCQVPTGDCAPTTELGTFDEIVDSLVLPVGQPTDR